MGTDINFNKSLGRTYGTRIGLPAFDPAASAYFASTGITGATEQTAIDNLVKGLKSDGLWSKMKAVYPFVTDNRNLLSYTEDFSNAAWLKVNVSVTANTTIAPDGTTTADTFQNTGVSGAFLIQKDIAKSAGTYTQSFYFKKNNNDWVAMYTSDNGANYAIAWFNVNTGVAGTVSAVGNFSAATSSITNVGSGWYRCSLTFTKPLTSLTDTSALVPVGDNSLSMVIGQNAFIWGTQIETGSILTTYQPMLGSVQAYIAAQFKYNLVNPVDSDAAFRLVFNGGWTHSANGALPNGTNGYANTYLVPNTSIPSINSAHISFYSRTNSDSACDIGAGTSIPTSAFQVWPKQSNLRYVRVFSNFIAESTTESTAAFYLNSRLNSTNVTGYRNGAVLTTLALNSVSTITNSIVISARSDGGTISNYSNRQAAFASIGDGLTDTEAANLYTRVQTFNQALSRQVGVPIVSDADAQAFLNSAEITDITQANAINTLVTDLKSQGLWTKMKAVYPFVGGTASTHKYNLKDPRDLDAAYRLVFNGGWTHSSTGATPNGTNGYADTFLIPSSSLSTSSAHFAKYNRTNDLVGIKVDGSFSTATTSWFQHNYSSANAAIGTASSIASYTPTDTRGLFTATRTATNSIKVFRNTTNVATNTDTISAIPNAKVVIGARNDSGGVVFYNSYQAAFASIGDGLTDAEALALYNTVNNYQVALSRNV